MGEPDHHDVAFAPRLHHKLTVFDKTHSMAENDHHITAAPRRVSVDPSAHHNDEVPIYLTLASPQSQRSDRVSVTSGDKVVGGDKSRHGSAWTSAFVCVCRCVVYVCG